MINKNNFNKRLQENFYLKKISSKIKYLLTIQLQKEDSDQTKMKENSDEILKIMNLWRQEIEEGTLNEENDELSQKQILEVMEWLISQTLTMKENNENLEKKLKIAEIQNKKYLKSLEKVNVNGGEFYGLDEDFDPNFYQRKLNQIKETIGKINKSF